ncbi:MAG: rhodanese-like domain-containing protein [Proteobacteria bacterium]|nr:rhodanese-like domain-containing protein [Pseudomonadota bacterium]MCP4916200.1 rhodanese-like domain-containing protein [Pseudomonadota bacterium]
MQTRAVRDLFHELGKVTIVDVRTPFEYAGGHITGAINMPPGALRPDELTGEVWVVCRSGARSTRAAEQLEEAGVSVTNVMGGMLAWRAEGHPVEGGVSPRLLLWPLVASLTLGLAPFTPEPHIVGKLKWIAGGAHGMGLMDWGDLLMHGAPFVWLGWALVRLLRR